MMDKHLYVKLIPISNTGSTHRVFKMLKKSPGIMRIFLLDRSRIGAYTGIHTETIEDDTRPKSTTISWLVSRLCRGYVIYY